MIINLLKSELLPRFLKYKFSKKYKFLEQFNIKKNDLVLDLGAHVGEISEFFLKKGCKVIAYEPNKYCYNKLKKLNNYNNFKSFNLGISNKIEEKKLFSKKSHFFHHFSQGSSVFNQKYNNNFIFQNSKFITLDNIFKENYHINLLKIDIEGSEYIIIDDLIKFSAHFDVCLIETHEKKYKFFENMHDKFINKINKSKNKNKFYLNWV